jgi:hypothetical protein
MRATPVILRSFAVSAAQDDDGGVAAPVILSGAKDLRMRWLRRRGERAANLPRPPAVKPSELNYV